MIFPVLNNMDAFVSSEDTVQEPEYGPVIIPEYKVPEDLGGAAREGDLQKLKMLVDCLL